MHLSCQTPSKIQTDKRTQRQRDRRTYARNRIWCILELNYDIWWQYFNDFLDNQQIRFRVFIGYPGFLSTSPPLNFYEASRFVHPRDGRPWQTQRKTKQTNGRVSLSVCLIVCLCLRWSLTPCVILCERCWRATTYHDRKGAGRGKQDKLFRGFDINNRSRYDAAPRPADDDFVGCNDYNC